MGIYKQRLEETSREFDIFAEKKLGKHSKCCIRCRKLMKQNLDFTKEKIYMPKMKKEIYSRNAEYKLFKKKFCEECNIDYNLHIHHINNNHIDNHPENLQTLCGNCHVKAHSKLKLMEVKKNE